MTTFSPWLGVLLVVAIVVPLAAVYLETSGRRLNRIGLAQWALTLYLVVAAIHFAIQQGIDTATADWAAMIAGSVLTFPLFQRLVRRARDAGMGKALPYAGAIPGVGLLVLLILLVKPSAEPERR